VSARFERVEPAAAIVEEIMEEFRSGLADPLGYSQQRRQRAARLP
jgi:hypothetical protein